MELPAEFIARMRAMLGEKYTAFEASYSTPAERAVRVNTLKISTDEFKKISPFFLERVPWAENGFYVVSDGPGKSIYHTAGLYYVQEPSAMCAAPELEAKPGERVLDLCSAPGGKGTQLAADMRGDGVLVLNEINFPRAKILSSNVERLGVRNAVVTCASPEKLANEFYGYFDKILVDAPCSGEGMFKKERAAVVEWSLENVKACAVRQSKIIKSAVDMLAEGGRMVYSTCTFSPEENEEQIAAAVKAYPLKLISEKRLYPHEVRGEGHFCAVLEKLSDEKRDMPLMRLATDRVGLSVYKQWEKENLGAEFENLHFVGKTLYSLSNDMPRTSVQTLRAGVRLGEVTGNRFEPDHSLAMCLENGQARGIEVDEQTALNFLKGYTFSCSSNEKGYRLVLYKGYPLGWCKVSGGVAKNKLPKGVRI